MAYLGIDLGTTNSVGVIFDDVTELLDIVKIDGFQEVLPSAVCLLEEEVIVGMEAKQGAMIYPEETILSIKREMGTEFTCECQGKTYTPEMISAMILKKIKAEAEVQAGELLDAVVITHPAYFNDGQIVATKQAGALAGFKQVHLLSEPLAAAIEYGYRQKEGQTMMVYDLGGGTFDVCLLKVGKDAYGNTTYQELSDVGDMHLGGDDFDQLLLDYCVDQLRLVTGISVEDLDQKESMRVRHKLRAEVEQLKIKLSTTQKAMIQAAPLLMVDGVPINFELEVTRDDFEGLIRESIERTRHIMTQALERAKLTPQEVDKVILVGGSTLIPMVRRMVSGDIKEPYLATDPAKSVAMGAAIYHYLMHLPHADVKIEQITRQIIGTKAIVNETTLEKAFVPIIPMGETIPVLVTDAGFKTTQGQAVRVDVFQWTLEDQDKKQYIGSVTLEGTGKDHGLEITYAINEDHIFEVYVKDLVTQVATKAILDREQSMPQIPKAVHKTSGVNLSFLIDTTGSMDVYIEGVKARAMAFSNILKERELDYNINVIGFGDLYEKEKPKINPFTKKIDKFQKQVKHLKRNYGGDLPESSLDALLTGIAYLKKSKLPSDYANIFILITDGPPHVPGFKGETLEDVKAMLASENITTYVVAQKDKASLEAYSALVREGHYYGMEADFYDILDQIAVSIAELVRIT